MAGHPGTMRLERETECLEDFEVGFESLFLMPDGVNGMTKPECALSMFEI